VAHARQKTGKHAEDLVVARLIASDWEIVERNARSRHGEIDVIGFDGETLVFVEVKAGVAGSDFGPERPVESVDYRKQRRIRRLAVAWMADRRGSLPRFAEIRFDAVGVTLDREGGLVELDHIRAAF
jgi:putative endonuclease